MNARLSSTPDIFLFDSLTCQKAISEQNAPSPDGKEKLCRKPIVSAHILATLPLIGPLPNTDVIPNTESAAVCCAVTRLRVDVRTRTGSWAWRWGRTGQLVAPQEAA